MIKWIENVNENNNDKNIINENRKININENRKNDINDINENGKINIKININDIVRLLRTIIKRLFA